MSSPPPLLSSLLIKIDTDSMLLLLGVLQVDELQNTIEEDQKALMEEMRMVAEETRNGLLEDSAVASTSGVTEAMLID